MKEAERLDFHVTVRVTTAELHRINLAAHGQKISVSEWARDALRKAAGK